MHRNVVQLDAADQMAGRLASQVAKILQGKHKPDYQPHIDSGDFVEIRNLKQVKFSGKKMEKKIYRRHTNYPGNMKETTLRIRFSTHPEKLFRDIVNGMLPRNKMRTPRIRRLSFVK